MSSAQVSVLRLDSPTLFDEPPVPWDEPFAPSPAPNLNHAIETALRARRIELGLEHRDLDLSISALAESGTSDELLLSRLKKRRLHLKDEIARIDGHLPV